MLDATCTMLQFKDSHGSYLRKHSLEGDQCGPFGLEYTFTLRETELNKNAVDEVPEWMLPLDALEVGGPGVHVFWSLSRNVYRAGRE